MKDRVPVYPGRVKLTPVSGQENVYDMTRADQPTQQGDPLNKATLLKDATAALFGLGTDAVPDDVLAYVGKYNLHWWAKYNATPGSYSLAATRDYLTWGSPSDLEYSDSIEVGVDGRVNLVSPQRVSSASVKGNPSYNNKFFKGSFGNGTTLTNVIETVDCIFIEDTSKIFLNDYYNKYYFTSSNGVKLVKTTPGELGDLAGYIQSLDRSAYPDSGMQGGYEYLYIGIPFENAASPHVKIATGSYVGTGKYGPDNPNSLTFDGNPQMVVVVSIVSELGCAGAYPDYFDGWSEGNFMWVKGATYSGGYNGKIDILETEHGISWNTARNEDASKQCNESGKTYKYFAIVN